MSIASANAGSPLPNALGQLRTLVGRSARTRRASEQTVLFRVFERRANSQQTGSLNRRMAGLDRSISKEVEPWTQAGVEK